MLNAKDFSPVQSIEINVKYTKHAYIEQMCTNSSNQGIYLKRKFAQHSPTFIINQFHINTPCGFLSSSVASELIQG